MKAYPHLQWRNLRLQSFEFENEKSSKSLLKYASFGTKHKATLSHENEAYHISIRYFFGSEIIVKNAKGEILLELKNTARWKYHWKGNYGKNSLEITRTYFPNISQILMVDARPVLEYSIKHEKLSPNLVIQQFAELPLPSELFHAILFMLIRPSMLEMMGNSIRMYKQE